ncbi:MAG TPA: DNA-formamidopyrimidine glycosylase family protein, partial [Solirubrobacteraceae bacterium]|nr:DNA-formamidopyrimidine glycosylase family protein [Solirubrobacteraceae bacterium]
MPELPEIEITVRRLGEALAGQDVESTLAPGVNALKTYDPPLQALDGRKGVGMRRRGKLLLADFSGELTLVVHLMSAGRLQLFDKRAGLRDRTSRVLVRLEGGRELRLREFGTRQAAWARLLRTPVVDEDEVIATMGPEAWPDPPPFLELFDAARPLHQFLRDQR